MTAALVAAVAGGLLLVNLVLQLPPVRARLEGLAQAAVRAPVEVRRVTFLPWSGVTLHGFRAGDEPRRDSGDGWVRVQVAYPSLLSEAIELREVEVVRTSLGLELGALVGRPAVQRPQSEGVAPGPGGDEEPEGGEGLDGEAEGAATTAPGSASAPPGRTRTSRGRFKELHLGAVEIVDSDLVVRSAEGAGVVVLAGCSATFSFDPAWEGPGEFSLGSLSVGGRTLVSGMRATLEVDGIAVGTDGLEGATAGGGTLAGKLTVQPTLPGIPFELELSAEVPESGASDLVGAFVDGFPGDPSAAWFDGSAGGRLELRGLASRPVSWTGEFEAAIPWGGGEEAESEANPERDGAGPVDLPAAVPAVEPGSERRIAFARLRCGVGQGWCELTDLLVHAAPGALRGSGFFTLDGRLGVNLRFFGMPSTVFAARSLTGELGLQGDTLVQPLAETGWVYTDAALRGTFREPVIQIAGTSGSAPLADVWELVK